MREWAKSKNPVEILLVANSKRCVILSFVKDFLNTSFDESAKSFAQTLRQSHAAVLI